MCRIFPSIVFASSMLATASASAQELATFQTHGFVHSVAYSPDGKLLVTAGDGHPPLMLWDVEKRELKAGFGEENGLLFGARFSPEGSTLAASGSRGTLTLWDMRSLKPRATLQGHSAPMTWAAYSSDGKQIASGDRTGNIFVWNAKSGKRENAFEAADADVWCLAWSPDSRQLASCGSSLVQIWDPLTGKERKRFDSGDSILVGLRIAYAPDGKVFAVTAGAEPITVRETKGFTVVGRLDNEDAEVTAIAFSPNGNVLVTGDKIGWVRAWTVKDHKLLAKFQAHPPFKSAGLTFKPMIRDIAFAPDGRTFATGADGDRLAKLWDAKKLRLPTLKPR